MKVLVTGGAGFIGSHLVEKLLAAGDRIRVVDDLSTGRRDNLVRHEALEFIEGDIRDAGLIDRCAKQMDAVVHLAAVASVQASMDDPVRTHQVNFDGTLNLLEASRLQGVKRFIYACSAAVYGDTETIPVPEEAIPKPLSPYAIDKLSGEHYLLHYYRAYGLAATSFRFFNIYGPRQDPSSPYSGVISIFVERLMRNQPITVFGDGVQTRDFVYVADLADLLVRSAHGMEGNGGVFNVGTGKRHSLLQLLTNLEKISGKKIERHHKPTRPGDIQHSCADVTRLKKTFGSAPATLFEEGLKKLLASLGI
ncbi:MAG: SDR family oxidoreductase [Sulfuricaulis sp.]|uniref:SDR family oxidoreductase n=1 Tax=Sulfuricaulis sp. TaxID=2003553 RepID=UPI0025D600E5|nr:SDR family oxidoreductase [Sulfuricaulis sp.]MCR4346535.1 SDR family oxidoreductase [Sulfuricaulis sp.]